MINNPFEQFDINLFLPVIWGITDSSVSNLALLLIFGTISITGLLSLIINKLSILPHNWQYLLEALYLFILSIVSEQTGPKGYRFFPHIFSIFSTILIFNLIGLLPYSFTATSHLFVTFTLGLTYFLAWIIVGIANLGSEFLRIFVPRNMPLWILPLLVVVEILSFFLRPISLSIRLFANMLAGHILLHILGEASIYILGISIILLIPVLLVISGVIILEMGICLLQAYIFAILLTIYLKDSLISH
jgi:F-type H+-transporting ATPase subunit a